MNLWQRAMMALVFAGYFLWPFNPGAEAESVGEIVLQVFFIWLPMGIAQMAWRHGFLAGALRGPELRWHHKLIEKAQGRDAKRRARLNRKIESLVDL